jgi:hypothetical protein
MPELLGTLRNLKFLVPHSLTLPEYLAQFECKLDYYLLTFTMSSSSVAPLLVSFCDNANMCRNLRCNVFPLVNGKLPVATNKAVVRNGMHDAPQLWLG